MADTIKLVSELRAMHNGMSADRTYVTDLFGRAAEEIERLLAEVEALQAEAGGG